MHMRRVEGQKVNSLKTRKIGIFVKFGSCSHLLKFLNSMIKVSMQKQKEQSWRYNLNAPPNTTHPPITFQN